MMKTPQKRRADIFAEGRAAALVLALAAVLFLGGCFDKLLFRTHYNLTGLPDDPALAAGIETAFKEETAALLPPNDKSQRDAASAQAAATLQRQLTLKMQSQGFYDAVARFTPDEKGRLWSGAFVLEPGARYTIEKITVKGGSLNDREHAWLKPLETLEKEPLDAETVLAAISVVRRALDSESCRFGTDIKHTATIDRTRKTAAIDVEIKQGPKATLGPLTLTGNETVRSAYLEKIIRWPEGDCYRAQHIDNLRGALFQTGLFGGIDIALPEKPDARGGVPVKVTLEERAHRTVSAGLTYYSDEGAGASLGWRHRNFLGGGEVFNATLALTEIRQSLQTSLALPFFLRDDQRLTLSAGVKQEDTDAYNLKTLDLGASISRTFTRRLRGSTGVKTSLSRIFDNASQNTRTFGLISFPQSLAYDTRNNALDPTRGRYLEGEAEPFVPVKGTTDPFVKLSATARSYHTLGKDTTIALRAKVGSIQGPSLIDVPATQRFYVGGSGSVRGFAYQSIGPQNRGDPTGGRGMAEASIELRHKFSDTIGAVAFVDAGSLTEDSVPDFSNLAVGGGVGLRYYTGVGPLRLDLATPLNERDKTSDKVQFYISIGQAF